MEIRAAMVELLLARRGLQVTLLGNPECVVERVRSHRGRANEPGTLYVAYGNASNPASSPDSACACLQIQLPARASRPLPSPAPQDKTASCSDSYALEEACEAVLKLQQWDSALKGALLEGVDFDKFLSLGTAMIKRPLAYFDRNLIVLAASPDYWEREGLAGNDHTHPQLAGQMPPDLAVDLVEDDDYLRAAQQLAGFYYESAQHRMFYGINTFDGNEYLARLVISLAEGEKRLWRGEEQLIDVYHAYLDDLHLRYAGNVRVVSSQNDSLHVLVHTELLGKKPYQRDEATAILESYGWLHDGRFLVAKLVFFEGVHWDTVSLYLCSLLERMVGGSCAFPEERQIVWMINLSYAERPGETAEQLDQRITESLVAILRNYACKAGLSSVFTSFAEARAHYAEANRALEIGQVRNPHYWYHRFEDYAFDYLLSRCVEELSAEQVCHPALTALVAHDNRHATEYARTLVCFLRNSQNTTHAAAELYIHRTSFMRRMAQLQEVAAVRLDDPDEVLHLLLSAKLLGL